MGGKVAMRCLFPDLIDKLIIADITLPASPQ
jgi:hypothetical protein